MPAMFEELARPGTQGRIETATPTIPTCRPLVLPKGVFHQSLAEAV